MPPDSSARLDERLRETEDTIHQMLSECLRRYPFFAITIKGETGKHGMLNVYVEGGPSIKHIIETDRLNKPRGSWSGSASHDNKD